MSKRYYDFDSKVENVCDIMSVWVLFCRKKIKFKRVINFRDEINLAQETDDLRKL